MTGFEAKKAGELAEENMRKMNIDWVSFEGRHFVYRSPSRENTTGSSSRRRARR
jgi:hypothetical protein